MPSPSTSQLGHVSACAENGCRQQLARDSLVDGLVWGTAAVLEKRSIL